MVRPVYKQQCCSKPYENAASAYVQKLSFNVMFFIAAICARRTFWCCKWLIKPAGLKENRNCECFSQNESPGADKQTANCTHWGLNPGPSACGADVIPLHHVPLDMLIPLCQIRGPAAAATATETLLQRATAPRPHSKRLANENNKCQAYRSRSFHKKRAHMCGFSICAALRKR